MLLARVLRPHYLLQTTLDPHFTTSHFVATFVATIYPANARAKAPVPGITSTVGIGQTQDVSLVLGAFVGLFLVLLCLGGISFLLAAFHLFFFF